AVWNTCMLFFQAALLGGYLYAHLGARSLSVRAQAALHLALLGVAALALPIGVGSAAPPGGEAPVPWLLGTMALTVGLPFFVLSGTGPMLQRWYAHTGRPDAGNPYWLYAASNLGSLLALLGYPFVVEPRLRLAGQSAVWSAGYALLAVLIAGCAAALWRRASAAAPPSAADAGTAEDAAPVPWRERAIWVGLAFIPSSLLLSVTTFITTDLAPIPLLWILPLALYLLTFTLAFAARPPLPHAWMVFVHPSLIVAVALLLMYGYTRVPVYVIGLHLAGLFGVAMVCHGELARRRPPVRHLTEFFLWISVGGVLGGAFNVLVAPVVFDRVWEYPLVLAVACLARPWPRHESRRAFWTDGARAAGFTLALLMVSGSNIDRFPPLLQAVVPMVLIGLVAVGLGRTPVWLAACVGAALFVRSWATIREDDTLLAERSFFGRFTVLAVDGHHALYHGSTLHGAQNRDPAKRREPITYYIPTGPFGQVFASLQAPAGRRRVAVVGLGTGTAAAYAAAGDRWTFYEIDPHVERMARDPRYFTYLADAPADVRVVLGDARLSLAAARGERYDLIVLDAFSSDAIPMHLLTREAMGIYLDRLAPGGMVLYHVSNRYLDLEPVVAALARERGLVARVGTGSSFGRRFHSGSRWVAVARTDDDLGPLMADHRWEAAETKAGVAPWTDDFSSILAVYGR
ncbi:MAG TPA: fused MFS/spermidine synthase, partial [Longimicrobium sp.]|nr:fused MFS/spermidine synthase [Longimicrobium sp.]